MYITNSFYKIEFKKMEITNNNSIISNGEDSRKIVLPVNVKNRYKAYTTEEWVTLAKEIAPNFDYSKTVYVNKETKVIIICPKHGEFLSNPKYFLWENCKCPKCIKENFNEEKRKNFIIKANKVHNNKYDYSKVDYKGLKKKVCIVCKEHGDFWQDIGNHLTGSECPKCANQMMGDGKRMTKEEFIRKAREVHGWKYDYSKVEYKTTDTKVCIICSKHGEFWQTPHSHLSGGGCPKCKVEVEGYGGRMTQNEFIDRAQAIHGKRYDYSKVEYKNTNTKVCIVCSKHGEFYQTPLRHIYGHSGCPKCKIPRLEKDIMKVLDDSEINYIWQYRNKELLHNQTFDFYLPKYNVAIECQGIQHFQKVRYRSKKMTEEDFQEMYEVNQERDKRKKSICKNNDIKLVYYLHKDFVDNLAKDDLYFTNKEDLKNMIEGWDNQLEKQ